VTPQKKVESDESAVRGAIGAARAMMNDAGKAISTLKKPFRFAEALNNAPLQARSAARGPRSARLRA
jgi:hypothetical protein